MSRLPQELIDRTIDHVDDRKNLKACSLVSSRWSHRSRKYLFTQVEFASQRYLERWCACIRPGPSGPSSLVEHLTLSENDFSRPRSPSWIDSSIVTDAAPHFQSLSALRSLEIRRWFMQTTGVVSMLHSFGSSLENVTRLTLRDVAFHVIHRSTLGMFFSHFPRLDDLSISTINHYTERVDRHLLEVKPTIRSEIVPTRPRGEFSVRKALPKVLEIITLLEPRFHRVILDCNSYVSKYYWPLVEACAGSLEELHIHANATVVDYDGLSLACCPNLRKIVLSLLYEEPVRPAKFVEKCVSTITSTQLSKVSLRMEEVDIAAAIFESANSSSALWEPLDVILYNLAGKYESQYEGDKMLVEVVDVDSDPSEVWSLLRRYRERGTLRVHEEWDSVS